PALRRLERIWLEYPVYFITTCTFKRRSILTSPDIAALLVAEWEGARSRHGWAIGRYVIMPDHVHFFYAPELNAKPLSAFIGFWKEWTSKNVKRVVGPADPVWQEEFFDHVLRSGESYNRNGITCAKTPCASASSQGRMTGPGKGK
ncbi:MAG: transposase, partial [Chthoniobacterales bacterium]